MRWMHLGLCGSLAFLGACSSSVKEVSVEKPMSAAEAMAVDVEVPGLKHMIGIVAFDDRTGVSSNSLFGNTNGDVGRQASDALAAHLIKSGKVVVLERSEYDSAAAIGQSATVVQRGSVLSKLKSENDLAGQESNFVGVSALIFGSVTEFGTKTEWIDEGLSKTKQQVAHAKVAIRMVDPKTGQAFYSEFGEADAVQKSTQTLGFGGKSGYDGTLSDKAINGAVVKLVGNMLKSLKDRVWSTQVVDTENGIVIGAGAASGLHKGMQLAVYSPAKKVKNKATGAMLEIPGSKVGVIRVESTFGSSDVDQGAICSLVSGGPFVVGQQVKEDK